MDDRGGFFNIVLVILVLKGFGLSSYTYAFLASSIIGLPIYFYISPWKVRLGIHKTSLHPLKYGFLFQSKNILATLKDDLLIAMLPRFITLSQIGYYGFAQKWAFFVYNYVVDSVTRVTFSTYSRIQHETEHMKKAIEKSLLFVSAIMFPMLTGIMITMPYFIQFIAKWHNKWEPATISIVFLCLNAMVSSMSGILVNVLDSTGHVKKTLQLMGIWTALTWTLTPLMIFFFGYNGVAIASFLITLTIVYTVHLVRTSLAVKIDILGSIKKPALATVVMGVVTYTLCRLIVTNMVVLIFVILVAGTIYFSMMWLLAGDEFIHDVKKIVRRS